MKKLFPLFLLLVLGFAACNQDGEGAKYAGTYTGTFKFITDGTTKTGSVKIYNNPVVEDGILLYVLPMSYTSGATFTANSSDGTSSITNELMTQLLTQYISSSTLNTAEEAVKNLNATVTFSGDQMTMTIYYTVEVLSTLQTQVKIIEFTGTKE